MKQEIIEMIKCETCNNANEVRDIKISRIFGKSDKRFSIFCFTL